MTSGGGSENIWGAVEESRVSQVEENTAVVTKYPCVKGFVALADDEWEEAFRNEDVINLVGTSCISRVFRVDAMAKDLEIGKLAGRNNIGHSIAFQSDDFVEVAH